MGVLILFIPSTIIEVHDQDAFMINKARLDAVPIAGTIGCRGWCLGAR